MINVEEGNDFDKAINALTREERPESEWKPLKNKSFETLVLTKTALNSQLRPAGFRKDGNYRQIKHTSLIAKVRNRCEIRNKRPKLAVCITMYNEDEGEL